VCSSDLSHICFAVIRHRQLLIFAGEMLLTLFRGTVGRVHPIFSVWFSSVMKAHVSLFYLCNTCESCTNQY